MLDNNKSFFVVKTGNDIVYIPRIKNIFNKYGLKFLHKILNKEEYIYCVKDDIVNINAVAKRFSAKEALVKALGIGFGAVASFKDVAVKNDEYNKPNLYLSSKLKKYIYNKFNFNHFSLDISLSDDKDYALATVVIIGYLNK